MRRSHLKFHITAITAICAVVIVVYTAINPKHSTNVPAQPGSDRHITIDNATWGRNCDPYIEEAQANWHLPAMGDKTTATPRPEKAALNNALDAVGAACNGQLACHLNITSDTMKTEPLASCYKRLTVGYRCFSIDRLWTLEVNQGADLVIDCHENGAQPAK